MTEPAATPTFPDDALGITVDELAAMLRISPSWIYKQVAARKIPYTRLGSNLRFSRANVEQLLAERSISTQVRQARVRSIAAVPQFN